MPGAPRRQAALADRARIVTVVADGRLDADGAAALVRKAVSP
ncbi:hypothetical protein STENM327S_07462 [Streptomyces tendae]